MAALGSFLIGAFYLMQYVPNLLTQIGTILFEINREELQPYTFDSFTIERAAGPTIIVLFAALLTFRPRYVAAFFETVRTAGLPKTDKFADQP